ncbi:MAG: LysR substrate-binding domain-containing protein [Tabrizicola sp.]
MPVSLRQLQIFRAVAQYMSYTRAAEALHLTQPAVFTQVRQLEEQLDSVLIERLGKRLFLTEAGEIVLASAREVLNELEQLDTRLAELRGLARGRLRIAIVTTAKYDIPRRLGEYCRRYPGIDVVLTVCNREDLLARLAANEDDLYILGTLPEGVDAEHHAYAQNPLVMIAPRDHRLVGRSAIPAAELMAETFVLREKGSGTRIAAERFFSENGIAPRVRMDLGADEAIKQAVMVGLGLSVIARGAALLELDQRVLAELDIMGFPLSRQWHVAWPRGKRLSVGARAFLDMLGVVAESRLEA